MSWRRKPHGVVILASVAAAVLPVNRPASGQTIVPISQRRSTHTHLALTQCADGFTDGDQAVAFEPFSSALKGVVTCAGATGVTTVTQQSQIEAASMTASASSSTEATAVVLGLNIILADSFFEVTFELSEAVNFLLDGEIAATISNALAAAGSGAGISLTAGDSRGPAIFSRFVEAGTDPSPQIISEAGLLEPGVYTLSATEGIVLDDDSLPSFLADASFDLLFQVQPLSPCADASRFLPLGDVPGGAFNSGATAISADGMTVLGQGTPEGAGNVVAPAAFVWTEASGLVGLGDLPGGSDRSFGHAISSDGSVIVGESNSVFTDPTFGSEAFRWTPAGGMVGLGDLPGGTFGSDAVFISADGSVVVGIGRNSQAVPGGAREVFRWTQATGMVGLGSLPGGFPSTSSTANAMSADGSVIVGRASSSSATSGQQAFRWTLAGGMVGLGDLPGGGFQSEAMVVSADGSVVAGQSRSEAVGAALEIFRWTEVSGMVGLGTIPGGSGHSTALAISMDGSVIVGTSTLDENVGAHEAFRWTAETGMVGLGDFPGGDVRSTATAVSADGSIIIGIGCTETFDFTCVEPIPFIWDEQNGMRSLTDVLTNEFGLDLTGWTNLFVSDMTPDGRTLVGAGINPSGDGEAWIAILGEPAGACCLSPLPARPDSVVATNRYLSFTEGAFGTSQAVRVTFASLPPPFDLLNGTSLWVGDPRDVSENGGAVDPIVGFPNFKAATLQCQPFFTDWSALGTVHVFHEGIVPGGIYNLQAVDASCPLEIDAAFSPPLMITTAEWGDVAGEFDQAAGAWTAPNGVVAVIADVVAILDKFASRVGAPSKARADLEPALPDQTINITDVVSALNAFGGLPFPFTPNLTPCGPEGD